MQSTHKYTYSLFSFYFKQSIEEYNFIQRPYKSNKYMNDKNSRSLIIYAYCNNLVKFIIIPTLR